MADPVYGITYSFISGTSGKTLPAEVTSLLPAAVSDLADGSTQGSPTITPTTVTVADGIWTFEGWDKVSVTINGADETVTGTWTFKANIRINYEWADEVCPGDVNPPDADTILEGTAYTSKIQAATNERYTFSGWYLSKDCTDTYADGTILSADTTLYGKWEKVRSFIKSPSKEEVYVGDTVVYTFANFGNSHSFSVDNYEIFDYPEKGLNLVSVKLPAFSNGSGVVYDVLYKTNLSDWKVLAGGVDASGSLEVNTPSLGSGEYITGIKVNFGSVPVGFANDNVIDFTFKVTDDFAGASIGNNGQFAYEIPEGSKQRFESSTTVKIRNSYLNGAMPRTGSGILASIIGVSTIGAGMILSTRKRKDK